MWDLQSLTWRSSGAGFLYLAFFYLFFSCRFQHGLFSLSNEGDPAGVRCACTLADSSHLWLMRLFSVWSHQNTGAAPQRPSAICRHMAAYRIWQRTEHVDRFKVLSSLRGAGVGGVGGLTFSTFRSCPRRFEQGHFQCLLDLSPTQTLIWFNCAVSWRAARLPQICWQSAACWKRLLRAKLQRRPEGALDMISPGWSLSKTVIKEHMSAD